MSPPVMPGSIVRRGAIFAHLARGAPMPKRSLLVLVVHVQRGNIVRKWVVLQHQYASHVRKGSTLTLKGSRPACYAPLAATRQILVPPLVSIALQALIRVLMGQ